jgi:hypothetical protein
MNSSTIVIAPLTKSPNCASHSTSASGPGHRVAVLEAHRGELRQQRVVDVERRLVGGQVGQRGVLAAGRPVDDDGVPVAEGAAAGVLPGQPDGAALEQQRPEGQRLAERPVDGGVLDHLGALLQLGQQPRVRREPLRQVDLAGDDAVDDLARDGGGQVVVDDRLGPLGVHRRGGGRLLGALEDLLQLLLVVLQRRLGLLDGDVPASDEVLGVDLADRALLVDGVVHQRLGERRLVDLAVAARR